MPPDPSPDDDPVGRVDPGERRLRVLLVEDDQDLREVLVSSLALAGIQVDAARDGTEALAHHGARPADLLLMDVVLPGRDGLEIATELRLRHDPTPIVFLSGRDALRDKLAAFRAGADDYVTKPFELAELIARIRAVAGRAEPKAAVLVCGELSLDRDRHEVRSRGAVVDLTATEFRLLAHLMEHKGRVLPRQDIWDAVWDHPSDELSVLENYISFLRRKLDTSEASRIRTVRGVGYMLRDD